MTIFRPDKETTGYQPTRHDANISYRKVMRRLGILEMWLAGWTITLCSVIAAHAQTHPNKLQEYPVFKGLKPPVLALVDSTIDLVDQYQNEQAIRVLKETLRMDRRYKYKSIFRAWLYQWLARNYVAYEAEDSSRVAKQYVFQSLQENPDIWLDHADNLRVMPNSLRLVYIREWQQLIDQFDRKRRAWRVALGTTLRADLSYRTGLFDVMVGVGTPLRFDFNEQVDKSEFHAFEQFMVYVRAQRMRRALERLTAGFFLEFALMEDLGTDLKPDKVISGGPVLAYAYQSGIEIGMAFEIARVIVGKGETATTKLSTVAVDEEQVKVAYANFEFYLRKWF